MPPEKRWFLQAIEYQVQLKEQRWEPTIEFLLQREDGKHLLNVLFSLLFNSKKKKVDPVSLEDADMAEALSPKNQSHDPANETTLSDGEEEVPPATQSIRTALPRRQVRQCTRLF